MSQKTNESTQRGPGRPLSAEAIRIRNDFRSKGRATLSFGANRVKSAARSKLLYQARVLGLNVTTETKGAGAVTYIEARVADA